MTLNPSAMSQLSIGKSYSAELKRSLAIRCIVLDGSAVRMIINGVETYFAHRNVSLNFSIAVAETGAWAAVGMIVLKSVAWITQECAEATLRRWGFLGEKLSPAFPGACWFYEAL